MTNCTCYHDDIVGVASPATPICVISRDDLQESTSIDFMGNEQSFADKLQDRISAKNDAERLKNELQKILGSPKDPQARVLTPEQQRLINEVIAAIPEKVWMKERQQLTYGYTTYGYTKYCWPDGSIHIRNDSYHVAESLVPPRVRKNDRKTRQAIDQLIRAAPTYGNQDHVYLSWGEDDFSVLFRDGYFFDQYQYCDFHSEDSFLFAIQGLIEQANRR